MSKKRPNPSTSSILETALEEWSNPPSAPSLRDKNNFSCVSDVDKVGKYLSLCNSLNPSGGGEFEVRLGIESNGRFQSGLKKAHFRKLANELESGCTDASVKESVDYFYSFNGDSHQHVRYECDEAGIKIERVIKKERQHVFDLEGKATLTYDMRISLSKEEVMHGIDSFPTHHPIRRRKKTRVTFVFEGHPWRFDLTTVKEKVYNSNEENTSYEAEVELDPTYITLLTNNGFNLSLAQKLEVLLQKYNKFDFVQDVSTTFSSSSSTSLVLFPIKNINVKTSIRNKINDLMDLPHNQGGFPGTMPCAMTRSSQQTITVFSHRVTWKADGERYFLCLFPQSGVFMINRKFDIFDVSENQSEFAQMMMRAFSDGREGDTILDGEIILNLQTNKHDYMIFDMISCNGAKTYTEAYDKRMEQVRTRLAKVSTFINQDTYLALPLQVTVKDHHDVSEMRTLRQKIRQVGPSKFTMDNLYGCDGVVFIPSGAYIPRVDHNMFKVKLSLEQITIDFEITPLGKSNEMDRRWGFYCVGKNKELMCCREQTMDSQQNQLCQALLIQYKVEMRSVASMRLIVECYYDINMGVWKILKRRTDKNVANAFSVYCQTMETLVEGLIVDTLHK